jgi:hypothetical protein
MLNSYLKRARPGLWELRVGNDPRPPGPTQLGNQGFVAPDDNTDARALPVRLAGISGQPVGWQARQ